MSQAGQSAKTYDLIIIGGGPAGIVGAATAAALGKSVALIDQHPELGGAGINTGTVPSKTLRETALTLTGARSRNLYGVDLSLRRDATVVDFLGHERAVKKSLNTMLSERLSASKADVFHGSAVFEDDRHISVRLDREHPQCPSSAIGTSCLLCGEKILIATGSSPVHPDIFPFDSPSVYDSDTVLEINRLPKTMTIVGAGTIGCEYACIFAALHTEVQLLDGRNVLLPFLDTEMSNALGTAMTKAGIIFRWKEQVVSCDVSEPGGVRLSLASGESLKVDAVLVAAGRKSNTDQLNLAAAGVELGERGLVKVNEEFQSNVGHIYAAGDVVGPPALASTSMEQARRAMRHAFGLKPRNGFPDLLPTGVYTIPEVGMVGETEESLKKKGVEYVVGRAHYNANARGQIIGDTDGLLKLLFSREGMQLIGVHAIGEQATELVHIGMIAMLTRSSAELFDEACFNIPTLGQLYKTAALHALAHA